MKVKESQDNYEFKKILLTFGGAFSNHIAATAIAGKLTGFKTVGIIRGDEWNVFTAKIKELIFIQIQII